MIFFDSHTHLMDEQYDGIRDEIVENAKKNQVMYMTTIGYNEATSREASKDSEKYEGVYATVGLHPENVEEYSDFDFIYELVKNPKVVAIGEIGLDYHWGRRQRASKRIIYKAD